MLVKTFSSNHILRKPRCYLGATVNRRQSTKSNKNVVRSRVSDIKLSNLLVHEYAWEGLDKWHDKTALVCAETGRSYTYHEVYKRSKSLAAFLRTSLKLAARDVVAILLPNVPEYAVVVFGTLQGCMRLTTINPIYTPDEIRKQLVDSKAKVLFTLAELYPSAKQALELTRSDIPIIVIKQTQNQSIPPGAINFDEITEKKTDAVFEKADLNDTACLPYSSGTTGLPKGVMLSHRNLVSNLQQIHAPEFRLNLLTEDSNQDVVPLLLPMYHIYGLTVIMLNKFSQGCKMVTVPKFGSQIFIKLLREHRPNILYAVPPIMLMLLNNPDIKLEHLQSLRQMVSSAAPLGAADIQRFFDKTKGKVNFMQIYGMTEASPIILWQSNVLKHGVKIGASGLLVPNTQAKIVDVDDTENKPLEALKSGELLVKGPQVMKGYHENDTATKNTITEDGWLRTGDIAHYDEDGQFFITDRLKELIKVKGFQVAPAELEEILRDHPAIAEAAVIGIQHSDFGEVPKAFVVTKIGCKISSDDIREYVASKVASYKQLSGGVVLLNSIPKTPSGKILRRELKTL